jgi:hypothetical protein
LKMLRVKGNDGLGAGRAVRFFERKDVDI